MLKAKHSNLKEETLYLTKEKYEYLLEELKSLKNKRAKLGKEARQANANIASDAFHTTSRDAFLVDLQGLNQKIYSISKDLGRAEIIPITNYYHRINLGDIVRIKLISLEETEEMVIRLVSYVDVKERYQDGIMAVSMSSEMGKAIYHQLVGETIFYGEENAVEILEKIVNPEVINVGDVIEVEYQQEGYYQEPLTLLLVESIPQEKVEGVVYTSIDSSMGKTIYNKKVGDELTYQTPSGKNSVKIINKQPLDDYQKSLTLGI
jgi:transcription elongation GreA/GreB family factor